MEQWTAWLPHSKKVSSSNFRLGLRSFSGGFQILLPIQNMLNANASFKPKTFLKNKSGISLGSTWLSKG